MSTTVNQLKKDVNKLFEPLTPEEKAEYVNMECWRCVDENSDGRMADLNKTIINFTRPPWNNLDCFNYTNTLHNLQIREMHRRWTRDRILGLIREDALIEVLLIYAEHQHFIDATLPVKQRGKKWKSNLKIQGESIEELSEFRNKIRKEINDSMKDDSWDKHGIERPYV